MRPNQFAGNGIDPACKSVAKNLNKALIGCSAELHNITPDQNTITLLNGVLENIASKFYMLSFGQTYNAENLKLSLTATQNSLATIPYFQENIAGRAALEKLDIAIKDADGTNGFWDFVTDNKRSMNAVKGRL